MSAANPQMDANTVKMLRAICQQKIRAREIPVEQRFLDATSSAPTDPKNFLSTLVAVVHPKGIESPAHIREGFATDDIPVEALQKLNIVGKAVTLEHGTWNDDEHRWSVRPRTAGHITDSVVDDDGRLLVTYKLHNNRWGRIAYDRIRSGTYTDVSSLLFILPQGENAYDYDCNSIALCAAGRHPETHTLAMCSHVNPEEHILVDPTISGANATTRKMVYGLFPEEAAATDASAAAEAETEAQETEAEVEMEVEEEAQADQEAAPTAIADTPAQVGDPVEAVDGAVTPEADVGAQAGMEATIEVPLEPATTPMAEPAVAKVESAPEPTRTLRDYGAKFSQLVSSVATSAPSLSVEPSAGQMAIPVMSSFFQEPSAPQSTHLSTRAQEHQPTDSNTMDTTSASAPAGNGNVATTAAEANDTEAMETVLPPTSDGAGQDGMDLESNNALSSFDAAPKDDVTETTRRLSEMLKQISNSLQTDEDHSVMDGMTEELAKLVERARRSAGAEAKLRQLEETMSAKARGDFKEDFATLKRLMETDADTAAYLSSNGITPENVGEFDAMYEELSTHPSRQQLLRGFMGAAVMSSMNFSEQARQVGIGLEQGSRGADLLGSSHAHYRERQMKAAARIRRLAEAAAGTAADHPTMDMTGSLVSMNSMSSISGRFAQGGSVLGKRTAPDQGERSQTRARTMETADPRDYFRALLNATIPE